MVWDDFDGAPHDPTDEKNPGFRSEKFMQASLAAMMVENRQGSRLALEEFDQLGRRASQRSGGTFRVPASRSQDIEGLGQKRGKVVVFGAHDDASRFAPPLPQRARLRAGWLAERDREAKLQRQVEAEPEQADSTVLALGPPFRSQAGDTGWPVSQDDGRLDLVAVLPARTGAPGRVKVTLGGQDIGV